ncbi:hypothetical protein SFR_0334 [Streptomyces sp. FR-008]|nr:hypothetical protein SFR_0334 [Streptomyces sp. FR-008]
MWVNMLKSCQLSGFGEVRKSASRRRCRAVCQ